MDKPFLTREEEGVAVLAPNGRFDAHVVPAMQAWLKARVDEGRVHLLVNLEQVHFVDTRALSTLVTGMKRCRQNGGDLRLCELQKPVKIIFELSHLNRAFQIFTDESEAIASFEGAGKTAVLPATIIQGVQRESESVHGSPRIASA